jgi:hypothetical protein
MPITAFSLMDREPGTVSDARIGSSQLTVVISIDARRFTARYRRCATA